MKKILVACSIVILSLFTAGCDKVIELTENESQIIAEYAAELLLKYDRNIDLKYYDDSDVLVTTADTTEDTTENTEEEIEVTTEATTEEVTEENTEGSVEDSSTEEVEIPPEGVVEAFGFDLAEFVGLQNMNIYYSYYMLTQSYPSYDQDGVYIEIESPAGYKLLVLKFNVENAINESQYIDLYGKDITYNIIINDRMTAKQMLTILLDDLYTYQKEVEASMLEETVVIFQVSDEVADAIENLKLKVTYDGKEQIISLE